MRRKLNRVIDYRKMFFGVVGIVIQVKEEVAMRCRHSSSCHASYLGGIRRQRNSMLNSRLGKCRGLGIGRRLCTEVVQSIKAGMIRRRHLQHLRNGSGIDSHSPSRALVEFLSCIDQ